MPKSLSQSFSNYNVFLFGRDYKNPSAILVPLLNVLQLQVKFATVAPDIRVLTF